MKKTFSKSVIKQIAHNTDNNLHTENLVIIAKELNDAKLFVATKSLLNLHEFFGHLTVDLKKIREKLFEDLEAKVIDVFENHEEIFDAL